MAAPELKGLTGQQKAGILLMAIGEDRAAKLFELMDEEELKELSQAMANLGTVNSKTIEVLFAAPRAVPCGTNSTTWAKAFSPITSRTNIPRPSPLS